MKIIDFLSSQIFENVVFTLPLKPQKGTYIPLELWPAAATTAVVIKCDILNIDEIGR